MTMRNRLSILVPAIFAGISYGQLPEIPKENFHIYILAGQSNMAGRGKIEEKDKIVDPRLFMLDKANGWVPAVDPLHFDKPSAGVGPGKSFGLGMLKAAGPEVVIGLVPCAHGGSPIETWVPGGYHGQTKGHPWDDTLARAKVALGKGTLKGIIWHQGESDSNTAKAGLYEARLHDVVARFRKEFGAPGLPFVAGQMGIFSEWPEPKAMVDKAHRELPLKVANTAFASAEGLGDKGDKVHFSAESARELGRRYAEAMKGLQSAVSKPRPNILFAIADDWSFGHASAYGCKWVNTPAFDRVAKDGILFTRAYTPNAKCAPSRAAILTGRYSWQLGEAANHMNFFPPKYGSFMEQLEAAGYFTGYTGKGWAPGIANDASGNKRLITGRPFQSKKKAPPAKAISNNDYAGNFAEFMKAEKGGEPWCFWYGATEPHRGYEAGVGAKHGKKPSDIGHVPSFWPDNGTVRNDMLDYAFEVEHFDNHLGQILDQLEQAGLLANTLVVATSDHGMPFPRCKGQAYEYSNHIPLAIMWPGGIKGNGRKVEDFVSFVDLAPTFLGVAGVTPGGGIMEPVSGRSLQEIFNHPGSGHLIPSRDHVLVGKERHDVGRPHNWGYPIRGIMDGQWLYLRNYEPSRWPIGNPETGYLNCDAGPTKSLILQQRRDGEPSFWQMNFGKRPGEELFNTKCDPDCVENLAGNPTHAPQAQKLRQQLEAELKAQGDARMEGKGHVFEEFPFVGNWNDFYEKYMSGEKMGTGWVIPSDYEPAPLD